MTTTSSFMSTGRGLALLRVVSLRASMLLMSGSCFTSDCVDRTRVDCSVEYAATLGREKSLRATAIPVAWKCHRHSLIVEAPDLQAGTQTRAVPGRNQCAGMGKRA